jgi:hypothetical protein
MRLGREKIWSGWIAGMLAAGVAALVIWAILDDPASVQEGPGKWIIAVVVALAVVAGICGRLVESRRLSDARRLEEKLNAAIRHSDEVVENAHQLNSADRCMKS